MIGIFRRWKKEKAPEQIDFIVAFLGNPGPKYAHTRHNAGFLACDLLLKELKLEMKQLRAGALYTTCALAGKGVLLMKPQTYMNLSGQAVRDMAKIYGAPPERVIVVFDDVNIAPGKLRVRRSGSDGGHNGIKSIIECLDSDRFPRVKIGVGPAGESDMVAHVMGEIDEETRAVLPRAGEAVRCVIESGVELAMQKFNG